ncbi:MAG: N-acetylmuramoyl-L-alanine amidase [Solirubrobacterales bacterium]
MALLGGLAWAVAPALSLSPYVPQAVDFQRAIPETTRIVPHAGAQAEAAHEHGEGPVRFVTAALEVPRFDLVGVAGELRPLEFRVRSDGEWSEWVETSGGEPVYTGGADAVKLRSRGARPAGKLHFVNVSGDHTFAGEILNGARDALSSAVIAVAGITTAEARPPEPGVIGRADWGADRGNGGCKPRTTPSLGKVKAATVHHTVTTGSYSRDEAAGIVLGICRFHRNGNGWNDIGYNALIDRFGRIYEGRAGGLDRKIVGAHAQGVNASATGVASIASHNTRPPSRAAKRALVRYLAWKLSVHGKQARGKTRLVSNGGPLSRHRSGKRVRLHRIFSHSDTGHTECAGRKMRRQLHTIRKRTQKRIERFPDELPPAIETPTDEALLQETPPA